MQMSVDIELDELINQYWHVLKEESDPS